MDFQLSFFEDEVRDGFYVPGIMKQAWGAELKVLYEIDRVCKKNNIKYFADFGTLLGAVRHNGFIPWDDDIDICMLREDFECFLEVAPKQLCNGYSVYNYRNNDNYWGFVARVVAQDKICFNKEHLDNFCQFPYIAGVDIFPMDYVTNDEQFEEARCKKARILIEIADYIYENHPDNIRLEYFFGVIKKECDITVPSGLTDIALRKFLYSEAEKIFSCVSKESAEYITKMMPNWIYKSNLRINKNYFSETIYLPFENIEVPVPIDYDILLKNRYGNYMKIVKTSGAHNYPYFQAQKDSLNEILKKDGINFLDEKKYEDYVIPYEKGNSNKDIISECLDSLNETIARLNNEVHKYSIMNILEDLQQLLIDLGNFIENIKGEGTQAVAQIEKICEEIYTAWNGVSNNDKYDFYSVNDSFDIMKKLICRDILNKEVVVFLPYSFSHWNSMESEYKKEIENGNEVYVVPVPYYYKSFDGQYIGSNYEIDRFEQVEVTDYEKINLELLHPDKIYFNAMWDNENSVMTVHPFFYSENLRKFTDKLILINPFKIDNFTKKNGREYYNMKYYCTMPGVIYADEVRVSSEIIKNTYIEKLLEFAGEDTKNIWERKIQVMEFSGSTKKKEKTVVLYYLNIPSVIKYTEDDICEKITKVYEEISKENSIVFCVQKGMESLLLSRNSTLLNRIKGISSNYSSVRYLGEDYNKSIVDECDIFYGDTSNLIQGFRNANKSVICQNIVCGNTVGNNLDFQAFVQVDESTAYASCIDFNGLFKVDLQKDCIEVIGIFPNEDMNRTQMHASAVYSDGKVYFIPASGNHLHIYDVDINEIKSIELPEIVQKNILYNSRYKFIDGYIIGNDFLMIPSTYSGILKISLNDYSITLLDEWLPKEGFFFRKSNIIKNNKLYIGNRDSGFIFVFDFEKENGNIYLTGSPSGYISAIEYGDDIIFAPTGKNPILIWDTISNTIKNTYEIPSDIIGHSISFSKVISKDNRLIFIPNSAKKSIELELDTGKIFKSHFDGDELINKDVTHSIWYLYSANNYHYFRYYSEDEEKILRISKDTKTLESFEYDTDMICQSYTARIYECIIDNRLDIYGERKYFSLSEFIQLAK